MKIVEDTIVGDLVANDYTYSDIFYRHKIDFCCGGGKSIGEVCNSKGWNKTEIQALLVTLNKHLPHASENLSVKSLSTDELIAHILNHHHRYIEEQAPIIQRYLDKIARVHGERHLELFQIALLFKKATDNLIPHLKKEELILFPNVKQLLEKADLNADETVRSQFDQVINDLSDDHTMEGELFALIAELSNNYTPPADACNTYKVAFAKLKEFESDLHRHVHLENNVLFKRIQDLVK